jgi:hypothetical protein
MSWVLERARNHHLRRARLDRLAPNSNKQKNNFLLTSRAALTTPPGIYSPSSVSILKVPRGEICFDPFRPRFSS